MNPIPPKVEPIWPLFRLHSNYNETICLQANCGKIPLGMDLEQHSFECDLYWMNDRLQILVMVGVEGKTIAESRTMGHLRMVTISLDTTASTLDVWMFARMAILIGVGSNVEVTEAKQEPDGSRIFPISHWVDETGKATCPLCGVPILGRIPVFAVGTVKRCPGCQGMILNRNQRLHCKPSA